MFLNLEMMTWKCNSKGCGSWPRALMTPDDLCPLAVMGAIFLLPSTLKREEIDVTRSTCLIALLMIDFVRSQRLFGLRVNSRSLLEAPTRNAGMHLLLNGRKVINGTLTE